MLFYMCFLLSHKLLHKVFELTIGENMLFPEWNKNLTIFASISLENKWLLDKVHLFFLPPTSLT